MYIKTPAPGHNLPELISYDGDPMLLMEFGKDFATGEAIDNGLKIFKNKANKKINQIAFAKLKKGYMVDNNGKVYTGRRLIKEYKDVYSNSGALFEKLERGKNFGYNHGKGLVTTKGISQYDYFSKNGKRVKLLGAIKHTSNIFDVFSLSKMATEDLDDPSPLSLPLPVTPIPILFDIAGMIVQRDKAEMDAWLEEEAQYEIDMAKLQGLEATRKAVNIWKNEYNWQLMPISDLTATKLIQGEFKTFGELKIDSDKNAGLPTGIEILFREVYKKNIEDYIYVVESIFINE